jgi:aspartate carbamoyltransferase catalytic subunit
MINQYNTQHQLQHLLSIEDLKKNTLIELLDKTDCFFQHKSKPNPNAIISTDTYRNKIIANIFFEPSTRTRATFEIAAQKLGCTVLNLGITQSSTSKGETLHDTIQTLIAMQCDILVLRHSASGAAHFIAKHCPKHVSVINAGDGCHAHPTQALLDMYTIRKHRGSDFSKLRVAIIGDVLHSRVARSQIHALHLLNIGEIRVIAPKTLLPAHPASLGVNVYHSMAAGLENIDVIMMLRLQNERMTSGRIPIDNAYYQSYGLTMDNLQFAKPDALIIHPGPINRNVEIQSELADGPQAAILDQVTNGIALRMSVISTLLERL